MDAGKGLGSGRRERGDGGTIGVWELGREVRPKPEQALSKLQTDPRLPGPWEQVQHRCTGLASEPTGVGAAPYPRAELGQRPRLRYGKKLSQKPQG